MTAAITANFTGSPFSRKMRSNAAITGKYINTVVTIMNRLKFPKVRYLIR